MTSPALAMATWPGLLPLHAQPSDQITPLTGWRYLTAWHWDWIAGVMLVVAMTLYLSGVVRLHRRGDRWPVSRLIHWLIAMGLLAFASMGFLGVYDNVLFWVHMVQHMILTMFVGVNIAQAAPVTLALRVLPQRPRKLLLAFLHSFVAKVLLFPPLTALAMIGYPFALYMTGLYDFTLRNDWAHDLMHIWMVYIGAAFFIPIIGIDPLPTKLPHPLRFMLVLLQMPGHAFIGVTIMGATRLIAEDWYLAFGRTWGPSPQSDQYWAGAILWATGDLTMFTVLAALGVSWFKDSQREAARVDRALDRQEELERAAALARAGRSAEPERAGHHPGSGGYHDGQADDRPTDSAGPTPGAHHANEHEDDA